MGGDRRSRLTNHRELVLTLIAKQPDMTLEEVQTAISEKTGVQVGLSTVYRFLKKYNITLKKRAFMLQSKRDRMLLRHGMTS